MFLNLVFSIAAALCFRGLQRCIDYRFRLYDYKLRLWRLRISAGTTTNFSYHDYRFRLLSTGTEMNTSFSELLRLITTQFDLVVSTTNSGYRMYRLQILAMASIMPVRPRLARALHSMWQSYVGFLTTTNSGYSSLLLNDYKF